MEVIEGVCTVCGQRQEDVGQFHPIECCFSFKAGMKKVVEFVDRTGLIEHTDSQLHEIGAMILDCPGCCWYAYKAKLKEGG